MDTKFTYLGNSEKIIEHFGDVRFSKPKQKNVINWDDSKKIILIVIFFGYFSGVLSEGYQLVYSAGKIFILLVIIKTFFSDVDISIESMKGIVSKASEMVSGIY